MTHTTRRRYRKLLVATASLATAALTLLTLTGFIEAERVSAAAAIMTAGVGLALIVKRKDPAPTSER